MGVNNLTGERTPGTPEEDRRADDERAEDLRNLDRTRREREDRPHYELACRCAGCNTELIVEVPQPYCDDCR